MAEWPELPKRKPLRAPRPEPRLVSAEEMRKAIGRIMKRQLKSANESQYDVLVCIRSVDAARAVFEAVPVEGSALEYGNAVKAELLALGESYWDSDGEYTSKGQVGDVGSDVWSLLEQQWDLEYPDIDKKEARGVLIVEMAKLSRLISDPPGETGETTISIEARGKSGTPYYLKIGFDVKSPREFDMLGNIYADEACQFLLWEDVLALISNDA